MYKIGMTQWVVGNEPLQNSFERLKKYGYDNIEFAAEPYSLKIDECKKLMNQYGISCHSLCGIFGEDRDLTAKGEAGKKAVRYLMDSVDFADQVGAELIIVVPSPVGRTVMPEGRSLEDITETAENNILEAAEYAKTKNIVFVIEAINRYETYFLNTLTKAFHFVKSVNHPSVRMMADVFHMNIEENSLSESLYMIKDYLMHVHFADNTREPPGMGHTDFYEVLRTLKKIGYQGSLTMEFMNRTSDPYSMQDVDTKSQVMDQYAKKAIQYIRKVEKTVDQENQ